MARRAVLAKARIPEGRQNKVFLRIFRPISRENKSVVQQKKKWKGKERNKKK